MAACDLNDFATDISSHSCVEQNSTNKHVCVNVLVLPCIDKLMCSRPMNASRNALHVLMLTIIICLFLYTAGDGSASNGCAVQTPTAIAVRNVNCVQHTEPMKRSASCGSVATDDVHHRLSPMKQTTSVTDAGGTDPRLTSRYVLSHPPPSHLVIRHVS